MRSLSVAVAVSSVLTQALAEQKLKVVNFENVAHKGRPKSPNFKRLHPRATPDEVPLINQKFLYAINLGIGTPSQQIAVQIDTGSSDLWVPITGSNLCRQPTAQCEEYGSYSSGSSTVQNVQQSFEISYGDGTQISGIFVKDNVKIGVDTLQDVQFAACNSGSSSTGIEGILGIGYDANQAGASSSSGSGNGTYFSLLRTMVKEGAINTMAYSMWLNDPDSAEGNVLFGGVDSDKYSGQLIAMPVVPGESGIYRELSVPLTAVSFTSQGQSFTFTPSTWSMPALLDSGTSLIYLPDDLAEAFFKSIGAQMISGFAHLPCTDKGDKTAKMTFGFNGPNGAKIDVLLDDLLFDAGFKLSNGQQACELFVAGGSPAGLVILGDAFMRSVYTAYDLENNYIGLAQAKFNVTSSNIKEIDSDGIPGASVMSTLAGATSVATAGLSDLPNAGASATASSGSGGTGSGSVETTAAVPTFNIRNAASGPAVPTLSLFGALAGTVTLMSVCGGAMMIWF